MNNCWAIAAYFNPLGLASRYINYQVFRARLNVPLAVVEWSQDDVFQLNEGDADLLVQVGGGDLMWQKERLFNILTPVLPDDCEYVVGLDADVLFGEPDWAERTVKALQKHSVVQPFTKAYRMTPYQLPESIGKTGLRPATSIAATSGTGENVMRETGFGWAMRRDVLLEHDYYDAAILGAADRLFLFAAMGLQEKAADLMRLTPAAREHYFLWAEPFSRAIAGRVGCVESDLYSLWHGTRRHRGYFQRNQILSNFSFDPNLDLTLSSQQTWCWSGGKPELAKAVDGYFQHRLEDGFYRKSQNENGEPILLLEV